MSPRCRSAAGRQQLTCTRRDGMAVTQKRDREKRQLGAPAAWRRQKADDRVLPFWALTGHGHSQHFRASRTQELNVSGLSGPAIRHFPGTPAQSERCGFQANPAGSSSEPLRALLWVRYRADFEARLYGWMLTAPADGKADPSALLRRAIFVVIDANLVCPGTKYHSAGPVHR